MKPLKNGSRNARSAASFIRAHFLRFAQKTGLSAPIPHYAQSGALFASFRYFRFYPLRGTAGLWQTFFGKGRRRAAALAALALGLSSCGAVSPASIVLWTDMPEFAVYAQLFNASQGRYKIETREKKTLARELEAAARDKAALPDMAAGRWLKSAALSGVWQNSAFLFRKRAVQKQLFYEPLLEFGKNGREQALLPVSFNLGAIVFLSGAKAALPEGACISLEALKEKAAAYNAQSGGVYSRVGFSPIWTWNGDFLYTAARLYGAAFREEAPFTWDAAALEKAARELRVWVYEGNGGPASEDDFMFKYSYDPPERLIDRGRVLFAYIQSSSLFRLSAEELSRFDYRWLCGAEGQAVPVAEDMALLGITKKCRNKSAAAAFIKWFYAEWTQKELLEKSREFSLNETVFGIGSGFSAARGVTETIFPQMYPATLAHLPPAEYLAAPEAFPWNWPDLKDRVIAPYLREQVRGEEGDARDLRRRFADWLRINNRGLSAAGGGQAP